MYEQTCLDLSRLVCGKTPFPHFTSADILTNGVEKRLFEWFRQTNAWSLTEADFYTQYEFSLLDAGVPAELQCLISEETIYTIRNRFITVFEKSSLELSGITAHKLVDGHRIGIHNDYIGKAETHRLVIQINPDWDDSKGGYLLLFNSGNAEDVFKLVKPINNSAFGFEISDRSYHAVSEVYDFSRYTIVYTFKEN